ncbi:preprotein translocase subunit SecA [bacterium]|nr:preprotein translocase subunit SecA [bacterium]
MDIFGLLFDSNKRDLARLRKTVAVINDLEPRVKDLSNAQMRERIDEIRREIQDTVAKNGNPHEKVEAAMKHHLPEVFALCRESSIRTTGMRNFDVQMIASIALHEGRIAEQKTGEGKTLAAVPALTLNSLTGRGSHLITVNDYLASHGAEWMGPIYRLLGISVGFLGHSVRGEKRHEVYKQDVVYGTNNEFGFDYLRDNMVIHEREIVQGELNFGIVDECDSILIDEARTPLIISGTSNEDTSLYNRVDGVIRRLRSRDVTGEEKPKDLLEQLRRKKYDDDATKEWDYEYDRKAHSSALTARGIAKVERELTDLLKDDPNTEDDEPNLFAFVNTEVAHFVQQSLRAHGLYQRDTEYVVKDGQVIIVDEFTGRLMFGRRYSDGLHQAIEAKEGLNVKPESQTLASITLQNFFRIYHKLAGMTGTAKTEEEEFKKIYGMDVVVVPTNMPVVRKDQADVVYKTEKAKYNAIADDVMERQQKNQPVLVGTVSIEKSERLAKIFKARGINCEVLNAKYHEKEAYLVAQAGAPGVVTIATNMAGRGTDIVLGGNADFAAREQLRGRGLNPDEHDNEFRTLVDRMKPQYDQAHEDVVAAGGLYVVASERHESRRIDNQLRGRSGRQGDPGESRFYLSLEDDLMKMYGGERVQQIMDFLKIEENMPIESGMLSKSIENAQKKVEGRNFDIRKHVLQYDDVMNKQRTVIYGERRRILAGDNLLKQTNDFILSAVERVVSANVVQEGRHVNIDFENLVLDARVNFPIGELNEDDFKDAAPKQITEMLLAKVHNLYEQKEAEIGQVVLMFIKSVHDDLMAGRPPSQIKLVDAQRRTMGIDADNKAVERWLQESVSLLERVKANPTDQKLHDQVREFGAPTLREWERVITLRAIDEHWIDHLNMLDHLRSGVSLRGYGQQDPVVVYAQEAFDAFENMKDSIQLEVIRKLFALRLEEPKVERTSAYNIRGAGRAAPGVKDPSGKPAAEAREAPKIGRNTKCYCGSGKKYKQCHMLLDDGNPPADWHVQYEKAYGEAPVVK